MSHTQTIPKEEARQSYLNPTGGVDWNVVAERCKELKEIKESLGNKHFTHTIRMWAEELPEDDQQRLLDIMIGGLANDDASVGVYITRPQDLEVFARYLEPIIREYHGITDDTKQEHDWNIPVGQYVLSEIDADLVNISMRARVARNVEGWNLPSSMSQEERIRFETLMVEKVFPQLPFEGSYHSLTPRHANEMSKEEADAMRRAHHFFNDMTTDNHLTASGIASSWPFGRGIWISTDKTKMIWVGEEDHLRIISIVHGEDLGAVDASLSELLSSMESSGIVFAEHPVYGVVTTCPTNMGTGKRQSVLIDFPHLSKNGSDENNLKARAKVHGLQARGLAGEHSQMGKAGTADISPLARFGVTEAEVTQKLFEGLTELYKEEREAS